MTVPSALTRSLPLSLCCSLLSKSDCKEPCRVVKTVWRHLERKVLIPFFKPLSQLWQVHPRYTLLQGRGYSRIGPCLQSYSLILSPSFLFSLHVSLSLLLLCRPILLFLIIFLFYFSFSLSLTPFPSLSFFISSCTSHIVFVKQLTKSKELRRESFTNTLFTAGRSHCRIWAEG